MVSPYKKCPALDRIEGEQLDEFALHAHAEKHVYCTGVGAANISASLQQDVKLKLLCFFNEQLYNIYST